MPIADNLARAIAQRSVLEADNARLNKQLSLLAGLYRTAAGGWHLAMGQRDALYAANSRLHDSVEILRLQVQKESRCCEEMRVKLARAEVAIEYLRKKLAEPLLQPGDEPFREFIPHEHPIVTEKVIGMDFAEPLTPEQQEHPDDNGDPAF